MMFNTRLLLTLALITPLIFGCTAGTNPQDKTGAIDFIDPNSGSLGSRNSITSTTAWAAPAIISEKEGADIFGSGNLELLSNAEGALFASSEVSFKKSLFFTRPSINVPWALSGLDMSSFESVAQTRLTSNPNSSNVYATWTGVKLGVSSRYISRYTSGSGWSTPLGMFDNRFGRKVLVAEDGSAVILWLTYAENGTTELHGRRFDNQNRLSLMDTIVIGQTGQFNPRIQFFDGWITANNEVKLYWATNAMDFPIDSGGPPTSYLKVWKTTYSLLNTGLNAWAMPEEIPNSAISVSGFINDFLFIPASNGDMTIMLKMFDNFGEPAPIMVFEIRAGVWSGPLSIPEMPAGLSLLSNIAYNQSGQVVLVSSDMTSVEVSPGNFSNEYKVFVTQYNIATGWLPTVQINNANPIEASSWGMAAVLNVAMCKHQNFNLS